MTLIIVKTDHTFEIPENVARCPHCKTKLYARAIAWNQQDDGTWISDQLKIYCNNEPDLESDQWDAWVQSHSYIPYVYWLPMSNTVQEWINGNYRFKA